MARKTQRRRRLRARKRTAKVKKCWCFKTFNRRGDLIDITCMYSKKAASRLRAKRRRLKETADYRVPIGKMTPIEHKPWC